MDKELHSGHRARMAEKYKANGAACADHELLEMLLYYSIPRVNTNETAIRLLKRFGSFRAVLAAPIGELTAVDGVGEKSARLIRLCGDIAARAEREGQKTPRRFANLDEIGEYLVSRLNGLSRERILVLLLSGNNELLSCERLGDGTVNTADVNIRQIMEYAILRKAAKIVLAHNHPDGDLTPSDSDVTTTLQLHRACMSMEIELTEHILVADGKYHFIMKQMREVRYPRG